MSHPDGYILVGYFRFVISDEPGVVGQVISQSTPGYAHPSDVPVYRRGNETKRDREALDVLPKREARRHAPGCAKTWLSFNDCSCR